MPKVSCYWNINEINELLVQSDYKFSSFFGALGMILGIMAFTFNYHMVPTSLPGYSVIASPAMLALSFFSEETPFAPKMIIFLTGQFIGYFSVAFIYRKMTKRLGKR